MPKNNDPQMTQISADFLICANLVQSADHKLLAKPEPVEGVAADTRLCLRQAQATAILYRLKIKIPATLTGIGLLDW